VEQTLIPVSYLTHGLSGAGERLEAERSQPGSTFSASKMPGENPGSGILHQTEARQALKMITADRAMAEDAAAASDVDTPAAMLERVGPTPPPPPPPRVSARQRGATPEMRDSYLPRRHLRHDQKTASLPERGSKMPPSEAEIHQAAGLMSGEITPQRRQWPQVTVGRIPIPTFFTFHSREMFLIRLLLGGTSPPPAPPAFLDLTCSQPSHRPPRSLREVTRIR
jgi:hypothetical protein